MFWWWWEIVQFLKSKFPHAFSRVILRKQTHLYKCWTKEEFFLRLDWWLHQWSCQKPRLCVAAETRQLHPLLPSRRLIHTVSLLSILPYNIKRALCRYLGVCVEALGLHTSLSFGITTEKQHSHLHEKSDARVGGFSECVLEGGGAVWGMGELHAGKGTWEKTDNNAVIYPHK